MPVARSFLDAPPVGIYRRGDCIGKLCNTKKSSPNGSRNPSPAASRQPSTEPRIRPSMPERRTGRGHTGTHGTWEAAQRLPSDSSSRSSSQQRLDDTQASSSKSPDYQQPLGKPLSKTSKNRSLSDLTSEDSPTRKKGSGLTLSGLPALEHQMAHSSLNPSPASLPRDRRQSTADIHPLSWQEKKFFRQQRMNSREDRYQAQKKESDATIAKGNALLEEMSKRPWRQRQLEDRKDSDNSA